MRAVDQCLRTLVLALALGAGAAAYLAPGPARAVPSFARQTGLSCEACHTVFPELTPFGRQFKLNGYVFENVKQVTDINQERSSILSLNELPPISVMLQITETHVQKALPDLALPSGVSQNDTIEFPYQASIFYAGRIAPNLGAFFQLTYAPNADSVGIDNTDVRFADTGSIFAHDFVYGLSLNNNPTSQDLWHGTPAWGFPFLAADAAPTGVAATLIDGTLAQAAGGLTAYAMIDKAFYAEFGAYRTVPIGFQPVHMPIPNVLNSEASGVIDGVAPYWRFAWQRDWDKNSLEIGTYGMFAGVRPGSPFSVTSGPVDYYLDTAIDAQYQWIGEDHLFTLTGTWIHEHATRRASFDHLLISHTNDELDTARLTGEYYYLRKYGASLQLFSTTGSKDPLLYGSGSQLVGSFNGSPDTQGATLELDYVPWLNTKVALQYTAYAKFDGRSRNYDGFGRSASDNNTLFLSLWVSF